jgi:WD40 repeat protein
MIQLVNGRSNLAPQQNFPIWQIPLDVALRIFSHMDRQSVRECSSACRQWNQTFKDDPVLKELLRRHFPSIDLEGIKDFKAAYQHFHRLYSNLLRGVYSLATRGGYGMGLYGEHTSDITSLAIHEGVLFSGSDDCTIKIRDLGAHFGPMTTLTGHEGAILCIVVEGKKLFSASRDCTIKVWCLQTNTCVATLEGHTRAVYSLVINNGKLFSGSDDKTIKVWKDNTCVATLKGHKKIVKSLVIANGNLFSCSWDKTIKVWDLRNNTCVATLKGLFSSLAVGGGKLFSGSWHGEIKIWDLRNYTCTATLVGRGGEIRCLAVRGGRLFSGSSHNQIEIWDLQEGSRIAALTEHRGWVNALAMNGDTLFSGADDSTIKSWDFTASHNQIFEEIADGLESGNEKVANSAFWRFTRMPEAAKNEIFEELDKLLNFQGEQSDQQRWKINYGYTENWHDAKPCDRAQAIRNYLERQCQRGAC